jgi:hypothetical protein
MLIISVYLLQVVIPQLLIFPKADPWKLTRKAAATLLASEFTALSSGHIARNSKVPYAQLSI